MFSKVFLKCLIYIQTKISKIQSYLNKEYLIYSNKNQLNIKGKILRKDLLFKIAKDISEYVLKNNINLGQFIENLDQESKDVVKETLDKIYYIYTHNVLEISKLFSLEEKIKTQEIKKEIKRLKKRVFLPVDLYEPSIFYYKTGLIFVPQKIFGYLKNKDFIDGGAYIGDSALIYEIFYQPRKIYAFEPELENFNDIFLTIKMNNLKKVIPINKGLGDKEEKLKICRGGPISNIKKDGIQNVNMITIDSYVFNNNLNVGLIKLYVEGFELNALRGAKNTIKKFKPVLLIAIYHNGEQFFKTIQYIQKITLDYKFIIKKLDPSSPIYEIELIAWPLSISS